MSLKIKATLATLATAAMLNAASAHAGPKLSNGVSLVGEGAKWSIDLAGRTQIGRSGLSSLAHGDQKCDPSTPPGCT